MRAVRDLPWMLDQSPPPEAGSVEGDVIGLVNGAFLTLIGLVTCIAGLCCHHWSPFVEIASLRGHTSRVRVVAYLADGKRVLSCSDDNTMRVWNVDEAREVCRVEVRPLELAQLAIAPHASLIMGGDGQRVHCREPDQLSIERSLAAPMSEIHAVAFVGNGSSVLCGGTQSICLWNLRTGAESRRFDGNGKGAKMLAVSPDGQRALSLDDENAIHVVDVGAGRELRQLPAQAETVTALALSGNGFVALVGTDRGSVEAWSTDTGSRVQQFRGHTTTVTHLAFSADGMRALSSSYDKTVRMWDVSAGKCLGSFLGHSEPVLWVDFAPSSRTAISCGADKTIRIWRLPKTDEPG
jgi:WD40 repeat protein